MQHLLIFVFTFLSTSFDRNNQGRLLFSRERTAVSFVLPQPKINNRWRIYWFRSFVIYQFSFRLNQLKFLEESFFLPKQASFSSRHNLDKEKLFPFESDTMNKRFFDVEKLPSFRNDRRKESKNGKIDGTPRTKKKTYSYTFLCSASFSTSA